MSALLILPAACGGGDSAEPLFPTKPECEGESIAPLAGQHPMVISFLEIGSQEDGFDLDNDGMPDNKLSSVGGLANGPIGDSFDSFDIVIPFEFFDTEEQPAADDCVKFSIYVGAYKLDGDGDDSRTATGGGDCNDNDGSIHPGAAEVADNFKDDDCDGLADEADDGTPSTNADDMDGDGVTIAQGDCDDTNDAVKGPGTLEVCGDGLDNDCDGVADFGDDGNGNPACSPYDDTADLVALDPLSFNDDGSPVVSFDSGSITEEAGTFKLEAGPSIFGVGVPVTDGLTLDLRITGATIVGDVTMTPGGWAIRNGHLGGVLDANTADHITGLEVSQINLGADDTLLDATFANVLGTILGLHKVAVNGIECETPDIDVDRDGLEAFCDSNPLDDVARVDMCVDGNGDVVMDELDADGNVITNCTEATDKDGNLRFVDGISVELNFETAPAILPDSLPALR